MTFGRSEEYSTVKTSCSNATIIHYLARAKRMVYIWYLGQRLRFTRGNITELADTLPIYQRKQNYRPPPTFPDFLSFSSGMPFTHHSHSGQFCNHGKNTLEEIIKSAIDKKFSVFALTEHMPREQSDLYPEEVNTSFISLCARLTFYI